MKLSIGAAIIAAVVACSTSVSASEPGVAPTKSRVTKSDVLDVSARRAHRGHVYRAATLPYYPAYYARPATYRPYPYPVPAPFFLGFAYLPFW